jgi:hypothetical protein
VCMNMLRNHLTSTPASDGNVKRVPLSVTRLHVALSYR